MLKNKEAGDNSAQTKLNKNLKSYQPIEGPSNWQLNLGLWWVEHRGLLRRILVWLLILASVSFLGYGIYGFADYYYRGLKEDDRLARLLVATPAISHNFIKSRAGDDFLVGDINVLAGVDNTYDLAAKIQNPNEDWHAAFEYFFIIGQNTTEIRREYILPKEEKYLTEFLYEGSKPASAGVKIINVDWQRVNLRRFNSSNRDGGIEQFLQERTNIEANGIEFLPGQSSQVPLNTLNFTAQNNSPFNYWEADFFITLQSGGRLLGINKYQVDKLRSGESRKISIVWPGRLSGSQIKITPSVNIFDEDNYIPFELGPGQLK